MSPMTRATADSMRVAGAGTLSLHGAGEVTRPSKPRMRKCPQRVGKSASATFFTLSSGMVSLYVSYVIEIGFLLLVFDAGGGVERQTIYMLTIICLHLGRCRRLGVRVVM